MSGAARRSPLRWDFALRPTRRTPATSLGLIFRVRVEVESSREFDENIPGSVFGKFVFEACQKKDRSMSSFFGVSCLVFLPEGREDRQVVKWGRRAHAELLFVRCDFPQSL